MWVCPKSTQFVPYLLPLFAYVSTFEPGDYEISRDYPEKKLNEHKEESPTLLDYGSDFPDVLVRRWMSHNPPTHENSRSQSLDRSGRVRMVKAVKRQNLSREREENTQ